jgi:transcriptional regulator GlxA family with amidase domain
MLDDPRRGSVDLRADTTRLVPLVIGDLHFSALIRHLCDQVDLVGMNHRMLQQLHFEESIYRYVAMLLYPDSFGLMSLRTDATPRKLGAVCEFIRAHLDEPLSLSRLEEVSGLSRRSLQYAFVRHYNLTPMEWVREQRLMRVRTLLRRAEPGMTVKSQALRCGFSNLASFASYYRERFGELPSETLGVNKNKARK